MKKTLKLFLFVSLLSQVNYVEAQVDNFELGCLPSADTAKSIKKKFPKTRGELQSSHSLEFLLPPILSQGQLGSCTSWSTAYYGMTILKRIENSSINQKPFSPVNLHSRIKVINNEECNTGSYIAQALRVLQNNGAAVRVDDELPTVCQSISGSQTYSNKIYGY
ncbi:MAG: hypothetical protein ACKO7D_06335 [Bacteroidota bacterium]